VLEINTFEHLLMVDKKDKKFLLTSPHIRRDAEGFYVFDRTERKQVKNPEPLPKLTSKLKRGSLKFTFFSTAYDPCIIECFGLDHSLQFYQISLVKK